MKMRRILSAVLVVMMLLSVVPATVLGVTTTHIDTKGQTTGPYDSSELYLAKTATLENDGTYTIRLEAFATGNPVTTQVRSGLPLDIVLVLDQSGSMFNNNYLETLRTSVEEFIDVIAANGRTVGVTHRVGIVGFASDENDGSSNNEDNTAHALAGGSSSYYVNTGVFLKDGSFKNYGEAKTTGNYVPLTGEPVADGTYYIKTTSSYGGTNYRELTFSPDYVRVNNPGTDRTDLFAEVNGDYLPASYLTAGSYAPVTGLDTSKTYYVERDGEMVEITADTRQGEGFVKTGSIGTDDSVTYWIDKNGDGTPETSVVYAGRWSSYYTYTGSDGVTYYRTGSDNNYKFTNIYNQFDAYIEGTTTITVWVDENDQVIDPAAQPVYELVSTTGWHYVQGGTHHPYTGALYTQRMGWMSNGSPYDPATTTFYVQEVVGGLTKADYAGALMPVSDGEAGAGDVTEALNIAVSKIAASGATRTSLGMDMAKNILDNRTSMGDDEQRQTVVIVFTDGTPGYNGFENQEANAAMAISAKLKDSKEEGGHAATVYTIGLYTGEPVSSPVSVFMHGLSSNYPDAAEMDDVATITYSNKNIDISEEGLTTEYKLLQNYVYRESAGSSSTEDYNYLPMQGKLNSRGNPVVQYYSDNEWKDLSSSSSYIYRRTTTEYNTDGKYYLHTADKEELYNIFPEIITDSTTTTLDQKWLTAETLIRDIMETGFVFPAGTTVTMSSLTGTADGRMITWADSEKEIDSVTVTDATATVTKSEKGYLSVINQGGYSLVEATGFDFNAHFFGTSKPDSGEGATHTTGAKLIITIEGVEATDKVDWNKTELTNNPYSGVWSPVLEDGTRAQIGVFPQPNTYFTDTIAVLDYAKTTADLAKVLRQKGIKHLDADGMNRFTAAKTALSGAYGDISGADGKLTYTPNTMKWDGYDKFYVFGTTDDAEIIRHSANKVYSNLWSRVTVIPANNVYYEDTFVQGQNGVQVGIEFSKDWNLSSAVGSNEENPEDDVQGWEDSLADDTGYSDGTAAVGGNGATATFTFTGTGVDVYSRTNLETGLIMASLYRGEVAEGLPLRTLLIDNFAISGDYYMIPTLSIHHEIYRLDGKTQYDEFGQMVLVPLEHDTYTVKLTVIATTDDADFDGEKETRSTYYLDGIRIYNPIDPDNVDSVVKEGYGEDELNTAFAEVRDILLDANSFSATDPSTGAVFIDQNVTVDDDGKVTGSVTGDNISDIAVYENLGPENEVYLEAGQSIAFAPGNGGAYYVGLKSPTGENVNVHISGADGMADNFSLTHTTDLFYEVGTGNGVVTITNTSGAMLSVTKIKVTEPVNATEELQMFRAVTREEVLAAADAVYTSLNKAPDIDIEIENPEDQEPETMPDLGELLRGLVVRIIDDLWDWFH